MLSIAHIVGPIAAIFLTLGCTEFPKPRATDGGSDRIVTDTRDGISQEDGKDVPGDYPFDDSDRSDRSVITDSPVSETAIVCASGTHRCDQTCVDDRSPSTCGTSCEACPAITSGTATCDGTKCGGACPSGQKLCLSACIAANQPCNGMCPAGTHNCEGVCSNNNAVTSCGTLCKPCSPPAGASATCDGTECGFTCQTGKKCQSVCGTCCVDADCGPRANQLATCDTSAHECKYACPANLPKLCNGTCIASNACCTDNDCPPQGGQVGRCDTSTRSCSYSCATGTKPCSGACIPLAACCSDSDCSGNFSCQSNSCSTTVCRSGFKRCGSQCIAQSACCPQPRDCTSSLDNDCDGRPDNTIDAVCRCAQGSSRTCDAHPGRDGNGPCRAGTQACVVASPPTISDYGACSGAVGPDADDCEAGGSDRDCDGIKGNGAACTVNVLVYVSNTGSLACGTPSADWPTDIMLIDENDPAGVPNGYTLITQFKAFRTGSATKRAIHRCATATEPYHSVGYGACTASIEDHLLGYVSIVNGGNGWVQLAEVNGKDFGPIGTMRSDVPQCCSTNCFATTNYVLK